MTMENKFKVLLVYPNLPLMLTPPLSVAIFTSILKNNNFDVDLFDTTEYQENEAASTHNRVKNLQYREYDQDNDVALHAKSNMLIDYEKKVIDYKPDVVMYVSVVEDTFLKTVALMTRIHSYDIPNIIGGVFPTSAPMKCLSYDVINVVGIGEGENTIVEFANAVVGKNSLDNVKGIWFADGENIVKNRSSELIDISNTVPDYSLFEMNRFNRPMGGKVFRAFPVETYRGCPYQCTYCNSPRQRDESKRRVKASLDANVSSNKIRMNFLRRKSMDVVKHELDQINKKYSPEFIYFIDDAFLARPNNEVFDFCEMYKDIKKPFWFNTRPENCTKENLDALKEVGCYRISFGIECGNQDFRKNILKRKGTNEDIIKWFEVIANSGIPFSLNLIIGFPGETRDKVFDTIDLVREIRNYDALTVSIFTPYHGTVLRDISVKNGWLEDETITVHTTSSSLLKMPKPYLSSKEIDGLVRVIPLYTFFDKCDWDEIRKAEIFNHEGNEIYDKYASLYRKDFLGEDQDIKYKLNAKGGTGCNVDPKMNFDLVTSSMSNDEIVLLTI